MCIERLKLTWFRRTFGRFRRYWTHESKVVIKIVNCNGIESGPKSQKNKRSKHRQGAPDDLLATPARKSQTCVSGFKFQALFVTTRTIQRLYNQQ